MNIYLIICFNIMKRELIKKYPEREFEFRSVLLLPLLAQNELGQVVLKAILKKRNSKFIILKITLKEKLI